MLAYFVIAGIAFGIAYWICSTGTASTWRAVVAFVVAQVCGWLGGIATDLLLFSAFIHFDAAATTLSLLGKGFWWSVAGAGAGAGYGVYVGRKKLKTTKGAHQSATPKTPHTKTSGNAAYAAALAEIEEGQLDKGTWARSFAESGGDESKAKAAYIKARANAIGADEVWMDTQPQTPQFESDTQGSSHSDVPSGGFEPGQVGHKTVASSKSGTSRTLVWSDVILLLVVGVVGYILYQETTKQQTVAANQVQAPAAQVDGSYSPSKDQFGGAPVPEPVSTPAPPVPLEMAVASIEDEIDRAYNYRMLPTMAEIPNRYPVFRTEAGQLALKQLKRQIDEKLVEFARPNQQSGPQSSQTTSLPSLSPQAQADLDSVAARAMSDYPYLATPAGKIVMERILNKRDELIRRGTYPAVAMTQAVNAFAPANAPPIVRENVKDLVQKNDESSQGGCRWATAKDWVCN